MDRPILFRSEMVRAILDGRKTQTRRRVARPFSDMRRGAGLCPYGVEGERLWVRERFAFEKRFDDRRPSEIPGTAIWYDDPCIPPIQLQRGRWRPGMFMPRHVSRLSITIAEVRVQRLHEISTDDVIAEGLPSRANFYRLWEAINGRGSWDQNPWVWAISFVTA